MNQGLTSPSSISRALQLPPYLHPPKEIPKFYINFFHSLWEFGVFFGLKDSPVTYILSHKSPIKYLKYRILLAFIRGREPGHKSLKKYKNYKFFILFRLVGAPGIKHLIKI